MDDVKDLHQGEENSSDLETLGIDKPTDGMIETLAKEHPHAEGDGNSGETELPKGVKERLGRQEKRHQREMRQMRAELEAMHSRMSIPNSTIEESNPYPRDQHHQVDEQIQRAVAIALRAQEEHARKAKEQEQMAHVYKKYQHLEDNLNKTSDKYDDFDDVVRGNDAPFTSAMRDAALMIENPGEVLYKLGKDRETLRRISQLHPLDQAAEIVKLSHALMTGGGQNMGVKESRPISQVKSNPLHTNSVTENTPTSEIRRRMKSGEWKSKSTR